MPFGEVTISWNRNGEADLAGYRIYYGDTPPTLPHWVDVGLTATPNTPSHTLTTFNVYGTPEFRRHGLRHEQQREPEKLSLSEQGRSPQAVADGLGLRPLPAVACCALL